MSTIKIQPDRLLTQSGLARALGVAQLTLRKRVAAGLVEPDFTTTDGKEVFLFLPSRLPLIRQIIASK